MQSLLIFLSTFLLGSLFATGSPIKPTNDVVQEARAAQTCADPSLTSIFVQAFSPSRSAHAIAPLWVFVEIDSIGNDWQIQGETFLGWENPQAFTVPFYQLSNTGGTDFIYLPSPDGTTVPTASGYVSQGIRGYAYLTQVCGSVPLLSVSQPSTGDHWYTTDALQHSILIVNGWLDAGTAFFVLPLPFSPSYKAHLISPTWFFVVVDSAGFDWQIQADAFLAWETAQEFTVPFYQLNNPTTGDWIYLPAVDGAPPSASGFVPQSICGYAYSAQICGSMPLYAVFNSAVGDHWYTTDEVQHDTLVANGWEDAGIPFFVLPLSKS